MDKLVFLLIIISFNSFGQEKELDTEFLMGVGNLRIINSFIRTGHKDLFFVDRQSPGQMYLGKYDSCEDSSFMRFILYKAKDSNKYQFIKFNNCGQRNKVTTDSEALQFFETNRDQIKADSIDERVSIDHTVFYSLYEFRDGKLKTYKHFCKACVDWDKEKSTRDKNQSLKLYRFFDKLDNELSRLIK